MPLSVLVIKALLETPSNLTTASKYTGVERCHLPGGWRLWLLGQASPRHSSWTRRLASLCSQVMSSLGQKLT